MDTMLLTLTQCNECRISSTDTNVHSHAYPHALENTHYTIIHTSANIHANADADANTNTNTNTQIHPRTCSQNVKP